ncbi:MAG: response regulator [Parvularculaceae bacterium]
MADKKHAQPASSRILLVDDDPVMCELAQAKLEEDGRVVVVAKDGEEALTRLNDEAFDLVISDLAMPVMDGYELTRRIRATENLSHTPVIVITGSSHANAVEQAFAAGATSFLAKPINWTLFSHAVRFVLRASLNEEALRAARDQAEAGAHFKDCLMSVMSHELRTPLNAIIGFGQLLSERFEESNDHLYKEYADYIVEGGRHLLESISDMLLASDARSGPITINETDTTLGELVGLAQKGLKKAVEASAANVSVALEDGEIEICCDRQLVSRALVKLVDNSLKFSERGVNVVIGAALTKSGGLALLVKDDGPGMSAETARLGTRTFTQLDMSMRRSREGLGLGLPLVRAIAKAHGGVFRLNSKPGEGTRAVLLFPSSRVVRRRASAAGRKRARAS